jgi:hypothetical protein
MLHFERLACKGRPTPGLLLAEKELADASDGVYNRR